MKEKLIEIGKQKTTWLGLTLLVGALAGLPLGSGEQLAGLLAGLVGVLYPEKA
mgnify:CR=1 FL=1